MWKQSKRMSKPYRKNIIKMHKALIHPILFLCSLPIEPAYFAALSADKKLFSDAYNKKIILVAPTTLMATLRTVERIWRLERQKQKRRRNRQSRR